MIWILLILIFRSSYFRLLQWQMRYRFWLCGQIWWILLRLFAIWWKLCQRIDSKRWIRKSFDYLHERFSFGFYIYRNHWPEIHRLFLMKSTHYFVRWNQNVIANSIWHRLWKEEKCSYLKPNAPLVDFSQASGSQKSVKKWQFMPVVTKKKVWKLSMKIRMKKNTK